MGIFFSIFGDFNEKGSRLGSLLSKLHNAFVLRTGIRFKQFGAVGILAIIGPLGLNPAAWRPG
jgi:hypothetical protein